jgi:hypothetical protein
MRKLRTIAAWVFVTGGLWLLYSVAWVHGGVGKALSPPAVPFPVTYVLGFPAEVGLFLFGGPALMVVGGFLAISGSMLGPGHTRSPVPPAESRAATGLREHAVGFGLAVLLVLIYVGTVWMLSRGPHFTE